MVRSSPERSIGDADVAGVESVRPRLLVVDDSESVRRQTADLLAGEFEVVGTLQDGAGIELAVSDRRADVVVLDVGLPGRNGLLLARALTDRHPDLRVVMLTIHDDPDYVRVALTAGALGYVLKHRLGVDLVPAVRSALAGRRFLSAGVSLEDSD